MLKQWKCFINISKTAIKNNKTLKELKTLKGIFELTFIQHMIFPQINGNPGTSNYSFCGIQRLSEKHSLNLAKII